jgi:cytochrome c oxidase subunit 1
VPTTAAVLIVFMLSSMLIAVPTGIKVFNWIATLWRGSIVMKTPLYFSAGFLALFTMGGITGVMLAVFPITWQTHDTYFVVAHFHYVLVAGSVNAIFAGLYYWYPKMTGRMMSETLGKLSFWLTFIGFNTTFLVQHSLGLSGMPRRVSHYPAGQGWDLMNLISTVGAVLLGVGVLVTVWNAIRSLRHGVRSGNDPWHGSTLEWFTPSPPPPHNFDVIPRVRSLEPMKEIRG